MLLWLHDRKSSRGEEPELPQLTVLAAAAVVATAAGLLLIVGFLTAQTKPYACNRRTTRFRDFGAAFCAMREAGALRQLALGAANPVLDGCIDLFLYGAFRCPPCGHGDLQIKLLITQHKPI